MSPEAPLRRLFDYGVFIPLELGGAPRNPKNLWPEPHSQSKLSDPLETQLKRKVCKGVMKLKKARAAIRLFKNTQGQGRWRLTPRVERETRHPPHSSASTSRGTTRH
jgi:hypothetical protein